MRYLIFITLTFLGSNIYAEEKIPEGYMMQIMEPTGGKILRPKGWFYNEGHRETAWMWTITKEDTDGGKHSYDTGVRIQTFMNLEELTGKTPEVFVKEVLEEKRKSADKIHKDCEDVNQGLFSRTCIEITEGNSRILYSFFWGNDIDIAIISIAGAKIDDWAANTEFFDTMSKFELIDMKRFGDDAEKEEGEQGTAAEPDRAGP